MTCQDLEDLRQLVKRNVGTAADMHLHKAFTLLRFEHEDGGCLCYYRKLRAEGKYLVPEVIAKLDAAERAA